MTAGSRGQDFGLGNRFPTPAARYDVFDQLLQSMRSLPNAEAAGGIDILPWSGSRPMRGLRRSGPPDVGVWSITPGYFHTAAVPILQGQDFTGDDVRQNAAVANVSETAARVLWPGEPAIGKLVEADGDRRRRVIGVVKDVRAGYGGTVEAAVYWPLTREGFRTMTVLARTSGDAGAFAAAMRTAGLQLDSKLLVGRPQPVSEMLDRTIASARFETLLFTLLGVLALIVAAIGVYGLMAFWVGARVQEMGVRMALGAKARDELFRSRFAPVGVRVVTHTHGRAFMERFTHRPFTLACLVVMLSAGDTHPEGRAADPLPTTDHTRSPMRSRPRRTRRRTFPSPSTTAT